MLKVKLQAGKNFPAQEYYIKFGRYRNHSTSIQVLDMNGEPYCTATVALEEYANVPEKYVLIKNYSENEGILEALVEAKIISQPVDTVKLMFVEVYVCKLLVEPS